VRARGEALHGLAGLEATEACAQLVKRYCQAMVERLEAAAATAAGTAAGSTGPAMGHRLLVGLVEVLSDELLAVLRRGCARLTFNACRAGAAFLTRACQRMASDLGGGDGGGDGDGEDGGGRPLRCGSVEGACAVISDAAEAEVAVRQLLSAVELGSVDPYRSQLELGERNGRAASTDTHPLN
jgi:hypothetical protein